MPEINGRQGFRENGRASWLIRERIFTHWQMGSLSMKRNEIYLAMVPFGDVPGMKLRPVLTLTDPVGTVPEILVAYISSVIPSIVLPSDILIDPSRPEHRQTNLKISSVLRLHKLATIHTGNLVRLLGAAPAQMIPDVSNRLRRLLNL